MRRHDADQRAGLVFIGRRAGGIEHVDETHVWQMPQGGVDPGEDTWAAAKRELYEETSVRSVEKLGEVSDWLIYDIPRTVAGRAWKGRYRGQRQKWFAVRFTGKDTEINVASPGGGHKAEFVSWRWEPMKNLPNLIVPFKRPVYERVVKEFSASRQGPLAALDERSMLAHVRTPNRLIGSDDRTSPTAPMSASRCSTRPARC